MVAKVISGKDVQGALNYNEQKVVAGHAECIMGNLFKDDVSQLTFFDKLKRFTDLNDRNRRTKTNTLHISLNFDSTEKLKVSELNAIASMYMHKIGFGDQPYVVYEHKDAAHQHVHIVTTLIKQDGKRIPIHFLGKNQSEQARKEIEKEFNLVVAEQQNKSFAVAIRPIAIEKAIYGKSLTKKSIAAVVTAVTRTYKFSSIHELNAVLRQFNITADQGQEKSIMFAKKGLLYSMINEKGQRVGIPIKASALPGKPMVGFLEKQFKLNNILRQPQREKLKMIIDDVLKKRSITTKDLLRAELQKHSIETLFRTNAEGRTYGITFVDNKNRTVFNGSNLGKFYGANAIIDRLSFNATMSQPRHIQSHKSNNTNDHSTLNDLLHANEGTGNNPEAALRLSRRRKRKRRPRF